MNRDAKGAIAEVDEGIDMAHARGETEDRPDV